MILRREGWIVIRFGETFTRDDVTGALSGVGYGAVGSGLVSSGQARFREAR